MRYAICYHSHSTVNGEPVGRVYALDMGRLSPDCWSYSRTPEDATQWVDYNSAYRELQKHRWPEAEVVKVG